MPRSRRPSPRVRGATARARRAGAALETLVQIMDVLRSPHGCPWDRQQTHASLRPFLLEETYEALDALDRDDLDALPGELGDVLFQCVFHAQIAAESGRFDIADAVLAITKKLIARHPHVFTAEGKPLSPADRRKRGLNKPQAVVEQWERLKARERAAEGRQARILSGIPRSMPSLLRAHEFGTRVAAVGFDWRSPADVVTKIEEEVRELREAVGQNPARAAEELGDLLFSIAQLARHLGVEPESALRSANDKFDRRFSALEGHFDRSGQSIHDATTDEMENMWQRVKTDEVTSVSARATPSTDRPRRSSPRSVRRSSRR